MALLTFHPALPCLNRNAYQNGAHGSRFQRAKTLLRTSVQKRAITGVLDTASNTESQRDEDMWQEAFISDGPGAPFKAFQRKTSRPRAKRQRSRNQDSPDPLNISLTVKEYVYGLSDGERSEEGGFVGENDKEVSDEVLKSQKGSNADRQTATGSYLQCPECNALYAVQFEEVEGDPRVVRCSSCLHEWFAGTHHLLWGEDAAASALERAKRAVRARREGFTETNMPKGTPLKFARNRGVARRTVGREKRTHDQPTDFGKPASKQRRRCTIFVGNLSFQATVQDLKGLFGEYGTILRCSIPQTPEGFSKGYGFVEMAKEDEAKQALRALQGWSLLGRDICVDQAHRRARLENYEKNLTQPKDGHAFLQD